MPASRQHVSRTSSQPTRLYACSICITSLTRRFRYRWCFSFASIRPSGAASFIWKKTKVNRNFAVQYFFTRSVGGPVRRQGIKSYFTSVYPKQLLCRLLLPASHCQFLVANSLLSTCSRHLLHFKQSGYFFESPRYLSCLFSKIQISR